MRRYFYTDGNIKFGPYTKEELKLEKINRDSKIWFYGLEKWTNLDQITELNDLYKSIPPELKSKNKQSKKNKFNYNYELKKIFSRKDKWIFIISIFVILILLVIGYSKNKSQSDFHDNIAESSYNSNENFKIYVEKFYRDLSMYGIYPKRPKNTIIKFSKLDQLNNATDIHGISFGINDDDLIEIYINPSSWSKFSKPMKYFIMYHELSHDVLNLDDLENKPMNENKLMFPSVSTYENKDMDDFIETYKVLFNQHKNK